MTNQNENATNAKDPAVEALIDALRDNLTPEAVAAIACWLQPASTNDSDVNAEIQWFTRTLVEMIGRDDFGRMVNELGI